VQLFPRGQKGPEFISHSESLKYQVKRFGSDIGSGVTDRGQGSEPSLAS